MSYLLTQAQKKQLISISRKTLIQYVREAIVYAPQINDFQLKEKRGVFVTLNKDAALRGCIGNILPKEPLYLEVRSLTISAASQDPRFAPVGESEINKIKIEISVLSALKKTENPDEIILGKHGVLVKKGLQSGVFLPQVGAETGWDKKRFMDNLCQHKAGLQPDSWREKDCEIFIFSAEVFGE